MSNAPGRNRHPYSFGYTLSYADAQIDLLGRGWQGFRQVCTLDTSTQLLTRQLYNQDFPLTGKVASVSSESGGAPLELTLTTYLSRASTIYPQQNSVEVVTTGTLRYTYTDGAFDYVTANVFADVQNGNILHYDAYGNNLCETWYGYVEYIDPAVVASPSQTDPKGNPILPGMLRPLQSSEMLYRYRAVVNDQTAWVLGLPTHQKASLNAADSNIATFNQGDLTLSATTYFPTTYNRQSVANWDSGNHVFLTTTYQYDGFGNRVTETLPGNRTTRYVFETTYNTYIDQTVSPGNAQGTALIGYAGYDPRFGIQVAEQDANGFISISALDGFGRLVARQGPVPAGTQSDTNTLSGLVTGSMHNQFMAAKVVSLETVAYLDDGQQGIYSQHLILQQFPDDNVRSLLANLRFVDGLSRERLTAVRTSNNGSEQYSTATFDYTATGKPSRKGIPFFCTDLVSASTALYASYQYDALDRPVLAVQPGGANGELSVTTRWAYGRSGVVTETQAAGAAEQYVQTFTHHWFDGKDCIAQTAVAVDNGAVTDFQFDPLARNWQSVDPNGVHNTLTYDSLSRKTSLDNPDQNTTGTTPGIRYQYDPATGLLSSQTDAAQASISYSYDLLGRVLTTTFQDGRQFTYQYDTASNGLGRVSVITITQGDTVESTRSFAYDEYGNIAQETLALIGEAQTFTTRSKYDPTKRLVEQTLPDQTLLQRTFVDGLLSAQSLDGVQVTYSAFTPAGSYSAMNYNNGATFAYQRNPLDQIYAESLTVGGQVLFGSNYQYDQLNQVLQIQEQHGAANSTQSFAYLGKRLVSATIPGFEATSYQYDAGGNLQMKNASRYSYDAHFPRQVESGGAPIYSATRDQCGRTLSQTSSGQTLGFQYDGLGCLRMVKDTNGTELLQAMSDDRGQRLRQVSADGTVTLTINPCYQVVKTASATTIRKTLFDSAGALASIVTQAGTCQSLYFRRDNKGSVTHCLDANGALRNQLAYDAFGMVKAVSGPIPDIPLYEGRTWDPVTGLYYFGARYYDPSLGTFLTPDTRLGGTSELQCNVWNRFAFELNNPLNHVDPDGHTAWWAGLVIGLVAIASGVAIVATGGAASGLAAVAVGAAAGALIGGGATAVGYSLQHRDDFSWKDFGIQVGISAGIGAAAGGLLAGISGPIAASAHPVIYGALSGGIIGAAAGAATTTLTSVAEGQSISGSAVGVSAALGFAFGAIGGGIGGKVGARTAPQMDQLANDTQLAVRSGGRYDISTEQIIRGPGVNGGVTTRVAWQQFTPQQIRGAQRALIGAGIFADFLLPSIQTYLGDTTPS
ncbi:MAG: RHS repeat-associated core domain-containing protein [Paraburkholderia sp.]